MKEISSGNEKFPYYLICTTKEDNIYGRQKTVKILWNYNHQNLTINIEYGTLRDDFVSEDGKFLILVFNGKSTQYPAPCNAVVYNQEGQLVHHLCAPNLSNAEMFEKHRGTSEMQGDFTGGGLTNYYGPPKFIIGIQYPDIQRQTGSFPYTESRLFNPETGEIGEIIGWELPWR